MTCSSVLPRQSSTQVGSVQKADMLLCARAGESSMVQGAIVKGAMARCWIGVINISGERTKMGLF